jgi:hypothetical protein
MLPNGSDRDSVESGRDPRENVSVSIRGIPDTFAGMFLPPDNAWTALLVESQELHPSEDVGLIKVQGNEWASIFAFSSEHVNSSFNYESFGYPEDALNENFNGLLPDGTVRPRPDLVFTRGYVRRRISWSPRIPNVVGTSFVEPSAVAGRGCSGSPILRIGAQQRWPVVGIYVGGRLNDVGTSVAYAVRAETFAEWVPRLLGHSLASEANVTP